MTLIDFKVEKDLHQLLKDIDAESEYTSSLISDMSVAHKKEYSRRLKAMKLDVPMKEPIVNLHSDP